MGDEPPRGRLFFQRNVPKGVKTWCHDCEGKGARWVPRAAVIDGEPAMAAQMQRCTTCEGSGRLDGFQPPM